MSAQPPYDPISTLPVIKLDGIGVIRKKLHYSDKKSESCKALSKLMDFFRANFQWKEDSRPGSAFINWKSTADQRALNEMTREFLETNHNGMMFWPAEETSRYYNGLDYATHSQKLVLPSFCHSKDAGDMVLIRAFATRIFDNVKVLFFRLNHQQRQSEMYKKPDANRPEPRRRKTRRSAVKPLKRKGPLQETPAGPSSA